MSYNMDGETYNLLYKRYLKRSPRELLELAGMKEGDVVWDLCAGSNGIVAEEALKMGAKKVIAIDANTEVTCLRELSDKVKVACGYAESFFASFLIQRSKLTEDVPNVVVCRQGTNYWFEKESIKNLASTMLPGSMFVFNTFRQEPSPEPSFKKYEIDGRHYVEVWQLNDDIVHHVQIAEGLEPHSTSFRWITPEEFETTLKPFFNVKVHVDNKSSIYVCERNGER